jgi:double-stranded uracil-DNA glycosylase
MTDGARDDTAVERTTVSVYEEQARQWEARRSVSRPEDAVRLRNQVEPGAVRVDLGCGPGWHCGLLGEPVVALDAAGAMLELARDHAPRAWLVQADLEALPFRDGSLGGAWARACYQHLPRARLPMALARLHWALHAGAPFHLVVHHGDGEGERPGDDFAGRFFAEWRADALTGVLTGAGFAAEDLDVDDKWIRVWARRARTLPDTVGPGMRLLVCGLNPSLYAADAGVGYARPGNRFWSAALAAGLLTRDRDPLHALTVHGLGMTDLVKRATASAGELSGVEYRAGAARVARLVKWLRPAVVCFVGLAGWRAAIDPRASAGPQLDGFAGVPAYVMPSTSGLNANSRFEDLVAHLRAAAALA